MIVLSEICSELHGIRVDRAVPRIEIGPREVIDSTGDRATVRTPTGFVNIVLSLAARRLARRACVAHRCVVRTELTRAEMDAYREDGFLVVEDLLDADELHAWREAVDEAVAERGDQRFAAATVLEEQLEDRDAAQDDYYERVFTQRVNLWQSNEKVRRLMLDERLGKLVADLAGADGIRIWHDQALIKAPYAEYTAYHLDVPYWSFTSPDALTIWVALDDATLENGCMHYVPGSHQAQRFDNVGIGRELGALFEVYPEWKDVAPVACPVRAGGACFHNGLTAHGAGANMTHGFRRAMTCAYMPDGSTFNGYPNVLPPDYVAAIAVGDVLDDERHNPLLFSRSGKPTSAVVLVAG
jgi:ectoine hydroxylase-related dioxygenase (phytanoyl-CoA dioxygenase family)